MKIALTNVPPEHADTIATALIAEHLAASVNMHAIRSVYRWKGEICRADEVTLAIRVAAAGVAQLKARLLALHPYELMEFVVLDIDAQNSLAEFIDYVRANTRV